MGTDKNYLSLPYLRIELFCQRFVEAVYLLGLILPSFWAPEIALRLKYTHHCPYRRFWKYFGVFYQDYITDTKIVHKTIIMFMNMM